MNFSDFGKCTDCGGSGEKKYNCRYCQPPFSSCHIKADDCKYTCPTCQGSGTTGTDYIPIKDVPEGYIFDRIQCAIISCRMPERADFKDMDGYNVWFKLPSKIQDTFRPPGVCLLEVSRVAQLCRSKRRSKAALTAE